MSERCEPPEGLRDMDGLACWVSIDGAAMVWTWDATEDGGSWWAQDVTMSVEDATTQGWRYAGRVPTPSDLAAAKEREAALVAENVKLRELAGRVCNAWDAIGGALETSSDVDDFNECEQATFELRSVLDGETS